MRTVTRLITLTAIGLLAGYVTGATAKSVSANDRNLLKFAGPPIDSFTYLGHYDGFRPSATSDVVILTTVNDAYLIHVMAPCVHCPLQTGSN